MLNIADLTLDTELDSSEMAGITGGNAELERLSALIDFSTDLKNTVADVNQGFGFGLAQSNAGAVTNNQTIVGGNGLIYAPVTQTQTQGNWMAVSDIGRVLAGG
jgi:hypothetical protein